jgi:GDSL-like Lipase/Acylhydrolase family
MRRYILLLISLTLLSCSPVSKYRNLPEVRSWESDIRNFEQLDRTVKYPDDAILFAGSSSIRLWSTIDNDMAPYHIIQRGYGGAKLSDFAVYARRIFDNHNCKALVLFVANDITGAENDKSPEEVAGLFRNVLMTFRGLHPSTPVFWIEVTPTMSRWKVWPEIQKANNLIKAICEKQANTYFIDTDFAFLNEKGIPRDDLFRADRLHLTEKGYAVWTGIIKNELITILDN